MTGAPGGEGVSMIIMIVVMIAMVYFMMIRPENKRKKEAEATRESIKNGHKVSADRVRIEFKKWAISTNDTADEEAKAAAKKAQEERAKAKAVKKAKKQEK